MNLEVNKAKVTFDATFVQDDRESGRTATSPHVATNWTMTFARMRDDDSDAPELIPGVYAAVNATRGAKGLSADTSTPQFVLESLWAPRPKLSFPNATAFAAGMKRPRRARQHEPLDGTACESFHGWSMEFAHLVSVESAPSRLLPFELYTPSTSKRNFSPLDAATSATGPAFPLMGSTPFDEDHQ